MSLETNILEKIECYVLEENKTVTYKWLSRKHNIHVNLAKRLLSEFVEKSDETIGVCYVIGGIKSDGSHSVVVGWRNDISNVKNEFETVTSEHVYSVQKSVTSSDLKVHLYSVDSFSSKEDEEAEKQHSHSGIRLDGNIFRNASTRAELKKDALLAAFARVANTILLSKGTKEALQEREKRTNTNNINSNESSTKNASKESKKPESKSPTKRGTNALFASQKDTKKNENKRSVNSKESPTKKTSKESKTPESSSPIKRGIEAMFASQKDTKKTENKSKVVQSKPKGLSAFFSKTNAIKKDDKVDSNEIEKKASSPNENEKENNDSVNEEVVEETSKETKVEKDNCAKTQNGDTKNSKPKAAAKKRGDKRRSTSKKNHPASKRSKIIRPVSDSDSSNDEEMEYQCSSPEERPATPPPPLVSDDDDEVIPETPQVSKKAKKKKLVEKTFLDSEGYLVTNKEYKLVSDSDEEVEVKQTNEEVEVKQKNEEVKDRKTSEEVKVKKNVGKEKITNTETKKKNSSQPVKQASIMNFFKRS